MKLKYGTRGSKLALHQTRYAIDKIKSEAQDVEFEEIMYYSSQGMGTFWASGDIIPFLTYEVMYPFLFSDRKSILNMIFMSELDDDKMAMRPLSKLARDILRQDKYY